MKNTLHLLLPALILAGCTSASGDQSQIDGTIERYYEAHASERGGQCLAPYIDGITRTDVVKDSPDRLVVDVRYLYRDRIKDQPRDNPADALIGCVGYGERQFVLARSDDTLTIEQMTGPRRN